VSGKNTPKDSRSWFVESQYKHVTPEMYVEHMFWYSVHVVAKVLPNPWGMTMAQTKANLSTENDDSGANDNDAAPPPAVTVTELAAMMQLDEDDLLQRLADILSKRADGPKPALVEE
jgi:hypothetical protein